MSVTSVATASSALSLEQLHELYAQMVLVRVFETEAERQYKAAKIGGYCHLASGQEAATVGGVHALEPEDPLVTGYRSHGLEALYERDIRPDMIVGTSVGALNGAFIAEPPQNVATARELGDVWRELRRGQVFPVNPLTGALGFLGARSHLVPDSGLRRLIRSHATVERLEETAVPLHVIATDVLRGDAVRLSEGPLVDAVMASAAIPGVLPPVDWNGRALMDGGVANNAPLSHAIELGADEIYLLPTGTPCELDEAPRGALAMLVYGTSLLVHARLVQELAGLGDRADIAVLPAPCPLSVQPTDFGHAGALIEQARHDARLFLDRRERRCPPNRVRRPRVSQQQRRPDRRAKAGAR